MTDASPIGKVVTEAWNSALNADEDLPELGFFALGGDSVSAIGLVVAIESDLHIAFPMDMLFSDATLSMIIAECEARREGPLR